MAERERCTQVRMFDINNRVLGLFIDLNTDATFVVDENANEIGLEFDSSTNIHYKEKRIGKLRLPFNSEKKNIHFVYTDFTIENIADQIKTIDTGIPEHLVECYLDAEVFVTLVS